MDRSCDILKSTCCTCLSKNRKLFLIRNIDGCLNNLFLLLSFEVDTCKDTFYMNSLNLHICWECKSVMKRFTEFCHQTVVAQNTLASLLNCECGDENVQNSNSLSSLRYYYKTNYDKVIVKSDDCFDDNFVDCGLGDDEADIKPEIVEDLVSVDPPADNLIVKEYGAKEVIPGEHQVKIVKYNDLRLEMTNKSLLRSRRLRNRKNDKVIKETNKDFNNRKNVKKLLKRDLNENKPSALGNMVYFTTTVMNEEDMLGSREDRKLNSLYLNCAFKCESCVEGFKDKNELDVHALLVHTKKDKHEQCSLCRIFVKKSKINNHKASHYEKYSCILCIYVSYSKTGILTHLKIKHCIEGITLPKEKRKTLNPGSKPRVNKAMFDKRTPLGFMCNECNKYFETKNKRWNHIQRQHRVGFPCPTCGKRFAFKNTLKKHQLIHSGPLPREQCNICHKRIRCDLMRTHSEIHKDRQKYDCSECQKTFACLATYEHHLKYTKPHSIVDVLKFTCSVCDKGYRSRGELRDHINYQHLGKTKHKCPICNKALATRRCVTRHVKRAHDGIKEQAKDKICGQCGKAFRYKKGLIEHEYIHSGERPLSCELCGMTFRQNASLYTHKKRIHKLQSKKKTLQLIDSTGADKISGDIER